MLRPVAAALLLCAALLAALPAIIGDRPWGEAFSASLGPRPAAWCGWEMRRITGRLDPALNRALAWLRFPRAAPAPGRIVVWNWGRGRGHVGRIVRVTGRCTALVYSGNDGGRARTREHNICNAVAIVRV
ncbi:MAG: hypothetical protein AB7V13_08335 [Pseudorhodoplanes sp.]|uniref:hypothetical protein n=1 Tax=Pseudorhodoplanes sp. TaxID=1934341 RepID=UPI003D099E69